MTSRRAVLVAMMMVLSASCARAQGTYDGMPPGGMRMPPFAGRFEGRFVDLTYSFDSTTVVWPEAQPFRLHVVARGKTPGGYFYSSETFSASEHAGTHLVAPIHFAEGRWAADEIPVDRFIGPVVVISVEDSVRTNRDYRVRPDDIKRWEKAHHKIADGTIVLVRTGWGAGWADRQRYFGTATPSDGGSFHFPGFSREAAEFLTMERRVDAVGLDTPSLDYGPSQDFVAHRVFAAANVPAFENVAHLDKVPEEGATLIALPMKIHGGSGGPVRIVAVVLPERADEDEDVDKRPERDRHKAPVTHATPRDSVRKDGELPKFGDFVYYEEEPVRLSMPAPEYPDEARRAGLEGTVKVQALIDTTGAVTYTRVVKSIELLDDAAVRAVRASRWKPAMDKHRPVAVWVEIPVSFRLGRR